MIFYMDIVTTAPLSKPSLQKHSTEIKDVIQTKLSYYISHHGFVFVLLGVSHMHI